MLPGWESMWRLTEAELQMLAETLPFRPVPTDQRRRRRGILSWSPEATSRQARHTETWMSMSLG